MRTVALIGMVVLVGLAVTVGCATTEQGKQAGYPYNTKYCVQCQSYQPLSHEHFQKAPAETKPAESAKPATAPKTGGTAPAGGAATQ